MGQWPCGDKNLLVNRCALLKKWGIGRPSRCQCTHDGRHMEYVCSGSGAPGVGLMDQSTDKNGKGGADPSDESSGQPRGHSVRRVHHAGILWPE